MGMAACAEIGDHHGLFQPAHGSAPDIMGRDAANPLACILSGSLLLGYLAEKSGQDQLNCAAEMIETAVYTGFSSGRLRPLEFGGNQGGHPRCDPGSDQYPPGSRLNRIVENK